MLVLEKIEWLFLPYQKGKRYARGINSSWWSLCAGSKAVSIFIGLTISVCALVSHAQTPGLEWARTFPSSGAPNIIIPDGLTTDASGNVYTTGYFYNTRDFDPGSGTSNLTSAGNTDIFVSKLSPAGNFIWAIRIGGISADAGHGIAIDATGNVLVTGNFFGTVDFDPGSGVTNLTGGGAFVLKLNSAGVFVWAQRIGVGAGNGIVVDALDDIVTVGSFTGTGDFDPGAAVLNLTSFGSADIFVSKISSAGNLVWVKQMGGTLLDDGSSVATDPSGNVYTTGSFAGTADFDPGAGSVTRTSAGFGDIFISKLSSAGNFVWAHRFGSAGTENGESITIDPTGNVLTTGSFSSTVDFDPGGGITNLTSLGIGDIFVSKLDGAGNFVWAKSMGGANIELGSDVITDASGNVYFTGEFDSVTDFDPGAGTFNLTPTMNPAAFVSKLDASGNFQWAISPRGTVGGYEAEGHSIGIDPSGNILAAGWFNNLVDFDPGICDVYLTATSDDIYIWKLNPSIPLSTTCAPVITSILPASGPIGTTVTISGTNFNGIASNNIVYFGATRATVTSSSTTQLTVTVPAGATYQPISVTVNGLTGFSSSPFVVTFPDGGVINACAFAPKVDYVSGGSSADLVIGDIDGDGYPDIVTANAVGNSISVFRNAGTPSEIKSTTFLPKVDFATGTGSFGLAIGDLDGDGKLDIVASSYYSAIISIFRNTSTSGVIDAGSFAAKIDFATPPGTSFVTISDLDGDGKSDIALTNDIGGNISIFRNISVAGTITSGSFSPRVDLTSSSPVGIIAEDIDGDRKPELIVANFFGNTVSVYRNVSVPGDLTAASFAAPIAFATSSGPTRLRAGDLNADDKPELVVTNGPSNSVSVFKNTSTLGAITTGSFSSNIDFTTGNSPYGIAMGDLDGDSWPDLAVSNQTGSILSVLRNLGTGDITVSSFAAKVDFAIRSDARAVGIADFDANGKPDVATPSSGSSRVSVLRNTVSSLPALVATGISPLTGPIGTTVTLTGSNFSTTPRNNTVKFNGTVATVTASTATSITTTVPTGATTGPVSIEVGCNTAITVLPFTITTGCLPVAERNALIALYNTTDGANWTNKTNWLSADESTWFGVTVSGCTVTKLILPMNNLYGPIPPEIENLPNLIELDLSHNSLTGPIPPELCNLPDLEKLKLNINGLDGYLLPEIGLLSSLQILNLSENYFQGNLPPELGNLSALTALNLSSNGFDDIPDELGNLVNLTEIDISHNALTGDIPPSFGNLVQLKKLIFNDNTLVIVDAAVGPLPALEIIQLENNGILSVVPKFTSANITHLSVENNNLDFSDLEPNIGVAGFTYIPQNRLLPGGILYFNVGATLTIPFTTGGSANSYQWYLGGAIVPGATSSTLVKPGMTFNDIGFYTLHVTSAVVPGLTLVTKNYQVMAFTDPCASVIRTAGSIDAAFNPLIDIPSSFNAVKLQNTGKIIVSAPPTTVNSVVLDGIARFNTDGTLDNTFTQHNYYPGTETLVIQPDNKILTTWNDTYGHVVRFNADGTDDVAFNSNAPQYYSGSVLSMAVQSDNKILVAHTAYLTPPTIERINADGTPDASFTAPADFPAYVLRVQSDGKILASLDKDIIRLLPSGAIDPGFNVDVDEYVTDMVIQPDGKIIITGLFAYVNGVPHYNVARLNADGSTDITFNPIGITDDREDFHAPYKIALQPDGKILIAGDFSYWNGYLRENILRINADGTTDCAFDSGSGANFGAFDMIMQPDGQILITGNFDHYDGVPRNGLARINNPLTAPSIIINPQPVDTSVCDGATTTFTTGATGTTNITYRWQFATISAGPYSDLSNGGGYSGVTTATLAINTTGTFGAGQYRCKISGDFTATVFTNDAGLFINPLPSAPTAGNGNNCGTGSVTLTAAGGVNGQYRWYTALTGGTSVAGEVNDTYITPIISATTTYYVTINNGTCESAPRTSVVATINSLPTAPGGTNGSNCGTGSVVLGATGGFNGQYRWYTALTGGTAIVGEVNSSYTTPSITITTTYYITISNGTCESGPRVPVVATINTIPTAPGGTPNSICGTGTVLLGATGGVNGQYRWYTVLSGGTAIAGEVNSAYATPSISATTTYYVTISNGLCESTPRTAVIATINPLPTAPGATPNSRCGTGTVVIGATGGVSPQYRWYTTLSGGTAIAGETNSSYTTPVISATTTYFVTINNGTCESAPRTPVIATVTTLAVPTVVTSNCTTSAATLTGPSGFTTYAWSSGATTQQITVTLAGTYTLIVTDAGGCISPASNPITFTSSFCNLPPAIATTSLTTVVEGTVSVGLTSLLSDPDNNLDLSTLKIFKQPTSGAVASIVSNATLKVDYTGKSFAGKDELTIEVCDMAGFCVQQIISIDVAGEIVVFSGISPNGNGQNDTWIIQYIELLPETKENTVTVFNRWGDEVFATPNYDNSGRAFKGLNKNGDELPTGTYFYKIEFVSGRKTQTGYLSLKR